MKRHGAFAAAVIVLLIVILLLAHFSPHTEGAREFHIPQVQG